MLKKTSLCTSLLVVLAVGSALVSSCSKDSDSEDLFSKSTVYMYSAFFSTDKINSNPHYYSEIDEAISNNELLYTHDFVYNYGKSHKYTYHYATRDLFVNSQGQFTTGSNEPQYGRFSDVVCSGCWGYMIQDGSTILYISLHLCADEDWDSKSAPWKKNCSKLKNVYKGTNFKSLSWYISKTYYTYVRNGNKIVLSDGSIFTITDDGLVEDGDSHPYVKFDLNSLK